MSERKLAEGVEGDLDTLATLLRCHRGFCKTGKDGEAELARLRALLEVSAGEARTEAHETITLLEQARDTVSRNLATEKAHAALDAAVAAAVHEAVGESMQWWQKKLEAAVREERERHQGFVKLLEPLVEEWLRMRRCEVKE